MDKGSRAFAKIKVFSGCFTWNAIWFGENVNFSAGAITVNYDGKEKHKTEIKDGAFIGSDVMLVAPVTIGEESMIGAGSVITKDVPSKALGIERNNQKNVEGYVDRKKKK